MEQNPAPSCPSLRIAFIHPDLGIGGAERLVVDAALGLSRLGHSVHIFTSSHNPDRAFKETTDGTLSVQVLGDSIIPRSIKNRFITLCAILRQIHLSLSLIFSFLIPTSLPGSRQPFDIYFVDQLSASIPLLRYGSRTRVLFYCHFPDLLLSPNRSSSAPRNWISKMISIYRIPLDWIEEFTTGNADIILVNSLFTAQVFKQTLRSIKKTPRCVYPGVDISRYTPSSDSNTRSKSSNEIRKFSIDSARPTILSINRFEEKKNLNLLLSAYIRLREQIEKDQPIPRLVFIGGYDERLIDNVKTLARLEQNVPKEYKQMRITGQSESDSSRAGLEGKAEEEGGDSVDVLFILNGSEEDKLRLLNAESTKMLGYTASNEHLGIGPLEGMACGLPVLAVDSGGPKETVQDGVTGFLAPPDPELWASIVAQILKLPEDRRLEIGQAGRKRVIQHFSTQVMALRLQEAILEALLIKPKLLYFPNPSLLRFLIAFLLPILLAICLAYYSSIFQ